MTRSDDRSPAGPEVSPKTAQKTASGQSQARETRLAAALRTNLRRRKTAAKNSAE